MSGISTWHERPILAPAVYGLSSLSVGVLGYAFGFLLTREIRYGVGCSLFMDMLNVLYFLECHRTARKGAT